ncbi:hypothetical protein O6P43_018527 [Quillaja saponaria]|uniref:Uncharacterized protein n=1 Tax=Quillaja saponaria TaxID=32244 RepID=A0AAD7LSB1_QUISA|nr:hypothetical protein O6P43_018527 [Quillaja saponaria]
MGINLFGSKKVNVHDDPDGDRATSSTSSTLRYKMKMSSRQLKELMAKVDMSKGNSELCRLIIKECWEGNYLSAQISILDTAGED